MTPLTVRMRSGDHLGDSKMSEKDALLRVYLLTNRNRQKRFSQKMKEEGLIYKMMPRIFNFCPRT